MKKIIIGTIFGLALLILSQGSIFANSLSWNTASNDCRTVSIANHDTGEGHGDPCWPGTSISANDKDSVNVRIYYHNNGTQNATNTRIKLTYSGGSSATHSFTGQITSDQGNSSSFTVKANTPSGSTLTFSSAKWLPNRSQSPSGLPGGQSGQGVLSSSGLNIGTITPGWDSQGSVVVTFKVSTPSVPPGPNPSGTLTSANSSCSIPLNQSSCDINFSWNTINPVGISSVTRDGGPTVATGNSGSRGFNIPHGSATFRLHNNGLQLATKSVSSSCTSGTTWNGSVCTQNTTPTYTCSIGNFTVGGALSSTVSSGDSLQLAWSTTGCNYVNISGVGNNLQANGTYTINPTASGTYVLTGYGSSGSNPTRSVSVTVTQNPNPTYACSISSFSANNRTSNISIDENDSVNISWNTSNCNNISISGVGHNLASSGNYTVHPSRNTRYTITASGSIGSTQTRFVDVNVDRSVSPVYSCSISDFRADRTSIIRGEAVNLSWSTDNCNTVNISTIGNVFRSGNQTLYPTVNTNYVLTAYGQDGSRRTRSVLVNVGAYVQPVPQIPTYNASVITTVATNITRNSAQLNGLVTNSNTVSQTVYFEYGTTVNMGLRTNAKTVGGNVSFSDFVYGLSPNTIYYFRAVSESAGGMARGSIEVFRTLSTTVVSTPPSTSTTTTTTTNNNVVQGVTVIGESSPIVLSIENRYQNIGVGDTVDYVVYYRNIGRSTLINPVLQVVLPKGIILINSTRGTFSNETNTLTAVLENLQSGQEGVVYLQGVVKSIPDGLAQIVSTAILAYTNTSGAQENAMAYALNNPKISAIGVNVLGASAFSGSAFGVGFVSWLIIILVILLIVLTAKYFYSRPHQTVYIPRE